MRIRKRAVPLPLSLLTPVPFSDLHHHHLVQLPNLDLPSHDLLHRPIRHHPPPPLRSINLKASEDEKMNKKEEREDGSMSSKQSESSAVTDNGVHQMLLPLPSTPSNQTRVFGTTDGRWCDGDKTIPLKKRKASFEMNGMVVTGESKMKSKTNKKCLLATASEEDEDYHDEDDEYEEDDNSDSKKSKKKSSMSKSAKKKNTRTKKKKRGSIMEGSRCSRVNGRGWRCMQATLVGYSLCEHHLGKGRLRSISSVRARSSSVKTTQLISTSSVEEIMAGNVVTREDSCCDDDDDEKKPISGRKRMRVGMVKARSLSSLLCQPNTAVLHQINWS